MLRNREVQLFTAAFLIISLAAIIVAGFLSFQAMFVITVTVVSLFIVTFFFTKWRYCEIEKLSSYLRQIMSGNYSLDVRDNVEGELSILKNEIYKVTLMLSEQRDGLQEDKLHLSNAISDISHQLKTPLTSMLVMADLLNDAKLSEEKRAEFTNNIRIQLERIDWLVSSLLKLSKIDAGTVKFKKERIKVKDVIDKVVKPFLIPMDIKEQNISVKGEPETSFLGDINWTAEALINILKNCIEHTNNGGSIHISFSENVLFTEIIISDNGRGILREDLPYIFKRFYKGKNAGDDSVGIGLAMAHRIITSQNGDIVVTSELGMGTSFQVKFYKQVI